MKKLIEKFAKTVPTWCLVAYLIGLASVGVTLAATRIPTAADFINDNISSFIRMITAYATSWIPFSLAEYIIFASPVLIALFAAGMIKYAERRTYGRAIAVLIAVIVLIYSLFTFSFDSFNESRESFIIIDTRTWATTRFSTIAKCFRAKVHLFLFVHAKISKDLCIVSPTIMKKVRSYRVFVLSIIKMKEYMATIFILCHNIIIL